MYNYQQQQQQQQAQSTGNGTSIQIQGRLVWTSGNLHTGQHQKDDRTKQLQYNQDGSPKIVFGFGLAIPKIDPRTGQFTEVWTKLYQALQAEALTLYPSGHIPQAFSMKYKDGDIDVDPSGVPYSKREGYAGHVVLACTTQLPIKYFRFEGGNNILVNDGFKNGDYVNVQVNIKAHPAIGQGKAGLYVNPVAVQFIQAGKEIINTPSGDQLFGMNAPAYAGEVVAHQAPAMPQMGAPGPMGGAPMPGQQQYAQPNHAPMPNQQQYAQPHYNVLPETFQPTPGAQPNHAPMPGQAPMGNAGHVPMPGVHPNGPAQNVGYPSNPGQAPMPGAPAVNGQTQYTQPPMPGQYAQPAYPSNPGQAPMPGMPPR